MTTPDATEGGPKKSSAIVTIAVVAVMSVLAAGGGWFLGNMITPQVEAAVEPHADASEAEDAGTEGEAAPPRLVELDAITTNLAYPSENWVRLEVSLLFEEAADEAMAQTIHQDILAYLRTVSLQQIEGARGFQHLKEDLSERAILRSEGKVASLLFRTFVIE